MLKHYDPRSCHLSSPDRGRLYQVGDSQYPSVSAILRGLPKGRKRDWQNGAHVTEAMNRGSMFHAVVEHHFRGSSNDPVLNELVDTQKSKVLPFWDSVQDTLPRITDIQLIESAVWHEVGCYAGTTDMVASFDGDPVILDWKTTAQIKHTNSTRYALQLSAYCGAINRMYGTEIRHGVIVLVSPTEAQILKIPLVDFWHSWLVKLIGYWEQVDIPQSEQVLAGIYKEYEITAIAPVKSPT